MYQEVHWVPEDRTIILSRTDEPVRVWTVYESKDDPGTPPTLPMEPQHLHGFFLEDKLHDWRIVRDSRGTVLKYYSRVALHGVWILVEYR